MTDLDLLRREYEIRHDIEVADALIAALGDEIAELTGQNIDLEVWRASAVNRAERAEAAVVKMRNDFNTMSHACLQAEAEAARLRRCGNCEHLCENNATLWPCSEGGWTKPIDPCRFAPSRWTEREA